MNSRNDRERRSGWRRQLQALAAQSETTGELSPYLLDELDESSGPLATSAPLPEPASIDLSFLQSPVLHSISGTEPGSSEEAARSGWRVVWRQTKEQLQRLFFRQEHPTAVYRFEPSFLEDDIIVLLRSSATVAGQQVDVMLEAVRELERPEMLNIFLSAILLGPAGLLPETQPPLMATLQWGSYDQTIVADSYGQATFPAVVVATILNDAEQLVTSVLLLRLEPATDL